MRNFLKNISLVLSAIVIIVSTFYYVEFSHPKVAHAAITLVQTNSSGNGYVNSYSVFFNSNVTAGDLLIYSVTAGNADTVASLTDNRSDTINLAATSTNASGGRETWLYYVASAVGGSTTFTLTWGSGQFADAATIVREYSGLTSTPLDQTSNNNDGANFVQTHDAGTTSATTAANELVILGGGMAVGSDPAAVAGSGYGNGIEQKGSDTFTYDFLSDKTVSSTGAQSGNFTSTGFVEGQAYIVTFKAPGGGAVTTNAIFMGGD